MRGMLFHLSLLPLLRPPAFPSYPACSVLLTLCWPSLSYAGPRSPPWPGVAPVFPFFGLLCAVSCLPILFWPPLSVRALCIQFGGHLNRCLSLWMHSLCSLLVPPPCLAVCAAPTGQFFATGTTCDTIRGTPCRVLPFTPAPGRATSNLLALCSRPSFLLLPPLSVHALCEQCAKQNPSPRLSLSCSAPVGVQDVFGEF